MSSQSYKDDQAVKEARRRREMYEAIDKVLDTFQWAYPNRAENRGEVMLDRENNELHLVVWVPDNDDPDSMDKEIHPLDVTMEVRLCVSAEQQVREIIHWYLCHEADEQMWFGQERLFYGHDEAGNTVTR